LGHKGEDRGLLSLRTPTNSASGRARPWDSLLLSTGVKGLLVRVGVDQAYGSWNAPVNPETLDFAYVPIPDGAQHLHLETPYTSVLGTLTRFPGAH
jgi:hypothetical protein